MGAVGAEGSDADAAGTRRSCPEAGENAGAAAVDCGGFGRSMVDGGAGGGAVAAGGTILRGGGPDRVAASGEGSAAVDASGSGRGCGSGTVGRISGDGAGGAGWNRLIGACGGSKGEVMSRQ
jgi:hypothetical protein